MREYNIEKSDFKKAFALRLRDAMISAGHQAVKTAHDVNIRALAEITGHSTQICRKYLLGQVIPDLVKLIEK